MDVTEKNWEPKKIWEHEGDWYCWPDPKKGLPIGLNSKETAEWLLSLLAALEAAEARAAAAEARAGRLEATLLSYLEPGRG